MRIQDLIRVVILQGGSNSEDNVSLGMDGWLEHRDLPFDWRFAMSTETLWVFKDQSLWDTDATSD